jgi:thiamine biosynthesis lipoprotein
VEPLSPGQRGVSLNAAGTRPARVGEDTLDLLERAVAGWRLTGGAFDPTVHDALVAAGYDRDIERVRRAPGAGPAAPPAGSPGWAGVCIDRASRRVELAPGVRIDLGAIAKGHAADVVTGELRAMGAQGALVSVGGDLRARGEAEDGHGWVIAIEDPFRPGGELARLALADGAVATSSRVRRAWRRGGRPAHHLIEPAAARPAWSGLAQASAITRDCWLAEVLATAAMVRARAASSPGRCCPSRSSSGSCSRRASAARRRRRPGCSTCTACSAASP